MIFNDTPVRNGSPYNREFYLNTWAQIVNACHRDAVPDTWGIGDHKQMIVGDQVYNVEIIGRKHDTYAAGGKAPLTFQIVELWREGSSRSFYMNQDASAEGGWSKTYMRNQTLSRILAQLPSEIQQGIRAVHKQSSVFYYSTQSCVLETTADKLFLLSEYEVFGRNYFAALAEGQQYALWRSKSISYEGCRKVVQGYTAPAEWSLRSAATDAPRDSFSIISDYGDVTIRKANIDAGVSFAFCF